MFSFFSPLVGIVCQAWVRTICLCDGGEHGLGRLGSNGFTINRRHEGRSQTNVYDIIHLLYQYLVFEVLKLNIQKTKIMASGPITAWEIDGQTVSDFILGGSKITADGDCSHEIKRYLLLEVGSYDQLR